MILIGNIEQLNYMIHLGNYRYEIAIHIKAYQGFIDEMGYKIYYTIR